MTTHREHDQTGTATVKIFNDPREVGGASGEAIWLADQQRIPTPDELQCLLEPVTLGDVRNLLRKDFLAPRSLEVSRLGIEARSLIHRGDPRIAY